jgi:hypothetical protein
MNYRLLQTCLPILLALVASADEPQSESTLLPVSVVKPVEFVDGTFAGKVTADEIGRMGRRELKFDGGHSHDFVTKDGETVETRTLTAYRDAMLGGGALDNGYATACASRFVEGWGIWEFLRDAKPARLSHFDKNWMGTLSVDLVGWVGSAERKRREADVKAGKSLSDYAKGGGVQCLKIGEKTSTFEADRNYRIEWLAAGDVNGDGIEDRLILVHYWAPEGRASIKETSVVTRSSASVSCSTVRPFLEKNIAAR